MAPPDKRPRTAAIRDYYRSHRLLLAAIVAVCVVAVIWGIVSALSPMPPRTVIMATGPEGSAYHEFGRKYQTVLARAGVKLRLHPTVGAIENLALLNDPRSKVDVGFLQSGTTSEKGSPGLESLGTVFYEPLWFFHRQVFRGRGISALRGRKISVGPEGSGSRYLAIELLARNGIDQRFAELLPLAPEDAGENLVRGQIDAALMLTSWDAPVVQRLLTAPGIDVVSYPRTDAYIALFPFLNKVVLPEGVVDLARNRPPANVSLIAPKASLAVRSDLHPALQYLLLDAAEQIHGVPGIFQKPGQFPAAESIDLPLSDEARQFYRSGRPFFQRHLPFWMAVLVDRLLVLLIPVIGVIYPLGQILPSLYDSSMRQRIYRLYGELRFLENELESRAAGAGSDDLNEQLRRLEEKAGRLKVPARYANMLYMLRDHIVKVRGRLKER